MMIKLTIDKTVYLLLMFIFLFQSCSDRSSSRQEEFEKWTQNTGKLKVLTTTNMINDLVKQVGGDRVSSLTLIQGELDPHSYQLVKGDDEKLAYADMIFYNGLGLEHGPSLHHYLIENPKTISLGDLIHQDDPGVILHVGGQKDPHIWMDISIWAKGVPFIVEALSNKDPANAKIYAENGEKLLNEMRESHEQVKQMLHRLPEKIRYLVTSHDAFNYFARAYLAEDSEIASGEWQKRFAAPEGLAPESQLSTSHIKEIIDHLKIYNVHIIFPESNVGRDSIRKIVQAANEQGLDVSIACCPLYGDAMGPPGSDGDTYLKMILHNAKMLSQHMSEEPR